MSWVLVFLSYDLFCFFKQKTAYEMRISDWSSDVRSSDLSPLVSSWGGVTSWIIVTSPSAGEAITPSPEGVALTGSRKNAATHRVMPAIGQASVSHPKKARAAQMTAAITTNLTPSG